LVDLVKEIVIKKCLLSILFIGLAWGQAESDTSQIDYFQLGIELANEDFDPGLSYMTGCSGYGMIFIPLNAVIRNVGIPKKHKHILASDGGKEFGKGYKKEYKRLRMKYMNKGMTHYCIGLVGIGVTMFVTLRVDFSGWSVFN
tara:strand:+ start:184 stop:612 length:429 start_codon:yes stop_codon:yes gene_type:complete